MKSLSFCLLVAVCQGANPIRKIVNLLQGLATKVAAEAEEDKELCEKFNCYAKTNIASLQKSVEENTDAIQQLESSVKESNGKLAQTEKELEQHKKDLSDAQDAIQKATSLRQKDAASFADESSELANNIKGLTRAISAIERKTTNFLQTPNASIVRKVLMTRSDELGRTDREMLTSFLQGSTEYSSSAGEITGVLKTMLENMQKDLSSMKQEEQDASSAHQAMLKTQNEIVTAAQQSIQKKTSRIGDLRVEKVNMQNDYDDSVQLQKENANMLQQLKTDSVKRQTECDQRMKMRTDEQVAISSTIKVLNDDSALDAFKSSTLSNNQAFLQTGSSSKMRQRRALRILSKANVDSHQANGLSFMMLALKGKKAGFESVTKMMDEWVVTLKNQQTEDDHKKKYCENEIDENQDKHKQIKGELKSVETGLSEKKEMLAEANEEVAALRNGIAALDKAVAQATEQRKKEHAAAVKEQADNNTALQLLSWAENNLNKFYNPALAKPEPQQQLSEEDRIYQAMGGEAEPTAAPGGIAGTGIGAFIQVRMQQAPPAGSYKKSEASSGIIAMINNLKRDLEVDIQKSKSDDEADQKEYETLMSNSAEKRSTDAQALETRVAEAVTHQEGIQKNEEEQRGAADELDAVKTIQANLATECTETLQNHAARKKARATEVDALNNAKAVLAGADYA